MSIVLEMKVMEGEQVRRGVAHWWVVMMDYEMAEKSFTLEDVLARSDDDRAGIMDFIKRLNKAGFIEVVGADDGGNGIYRVMRRQGEAPKVRRDGSIVEGVGKHQAMWNLMRGPVGAAGFGADDLVAWASTIDCRIGRETARSYIHRLSAAGYLMRMGGGRWRLYPHMNSGRQAPKILRTHAVFDPNIAKVIGRIEVEEAVI